jgi:glycosyltransferase involved in cell wall biosynthesis
VNTDGIGRDEAASTPLVSVVITTYNRPSYLRKAVESVLDQTYDEIELVVVDDHSNTPASEAVAGVDVESISAFHCVRHEENRGANAARNTGIRTASGEYIAFLDDDDRWKPEKVERQVRTFESAGESVGVVYTGIESIRAEGRKTSIPPAVERDMTRVLLCRNVVGTMSVVMVRADIAKATPLDERFPAWADLEWYINLSRKTGFERIAEPLVVYDFTSHDRLSDDFEKKRDSYELFIERFEPVAAEYGPVFQRKMRGWAAYRVGNAALTTGHYEQARRFFAVAVVAYPFELEFLTYFVALLGGRTTHGIIRTARRFLP